MQLVEDFKVPVLITSYGNPTEYVKRAAKSGTTVFHDVINLKREGARGRCGHHWRFIGAAATLVAFHLRIDSLFEII